MSKMTQTGVSTTLPGQEQFEEFKMGKSKCVQYDYRTPDGKLFSCVKKTVELCRETRDKWLEKLSA